jgi:hypothetical protein
MQIGTDSNSRRPDNVTDHTLARLTEVPLCLLVELLKLVDRVGSII